MRLAWERDSDGKRVNVCCACAESGKVNANSINNFTTEDTIYTGEGVKRVMTNRDKVGRQLRSQYIKAGV